MYRLGFGVMALAVAALATPAMAQQPAEQPAEQEAAAGEQAEAQNIVDRLAQDERFSTLVEAVQAAGLAETLRGEGPYTIFAPTNEAFEQLPEGKLEELLQPANQQQLADILNYHVLAEKVTAEQVMGLEGLDTAEGAKVATAQGSELTITSQADALMVNQAQITETDLQASNGVIHVIDQVLTPSE